MVIVLESREDSLVGIQGVKTTLETRKREPNPCRLKISKTEANIKKKY